MDNNAKFSDSDIQALEFFLANVQGVKVNKAALKDSMQNSTRDLEGVLAYVKNMDQLPAEERIFVIDAPSSRHLVGAAGGSTSSSGRTPQ